MTKPFSPCAKITVHTATDRLNFALNLGAVGGMAGAAFVAVASPGETLALASLLVFAETSFRALRGERPACDQKTKTPLSNPLRARMQRAADEMMRRLGGSRHQPEIEANAHDEGHYRTGANGTKIWLSSELANHGTTEDQTALVAFNVARMKAGHVGKAHLIKAVGTVAAYQFGLDAAFASAAANPDGWVRFGLSAAAACVCYAAAKYFERCFVGESVHQADRLAAQLTAPQQYAHALEARAAKACIITGGRSLAPDKKRSFFSTQPSLKSRLKHVQSIAHHG